MAERRLVSVLFADLVGFTALSEDRDPEEVRDLLSRYFDTARQIVERYGGIVEKFIGDAVMAVWGTPAAKEDDAERAVRAALDLVDGVSTLGAEIGSSDLQARAGVLTGEAAVTLGAEGQGMVAGDLVNTASRVQAIADPGTVLAGDSTKRASEAAVAYEDAGVHELKGKVEPTQLWRALRVVGGLGGALKGIGLEAPFVGRDAELRLVKQLYHAAVDERKAQLVSVLGIAGIGKSRLSWEFFKYIDGVADTAWWHRGRCLAYGEGVTYWALAEMVRMRARIAEGEDQAAARDRLRATLEQHILDADEREWIEPRLAQLLGMEERAASDPEDLYGAWRLFFERLTEVHPVILVFEDMQWADAALLDFIDYLMNWSRNHPIFVLTLARPELLERHPNWGAGRRATTTISLDPLSEPAMEALLSGMVPGLPEDLRRRILERAEGVPLYAVETVRMLLDRGLLEQTGNEYQVVAPIEALDVPESLHALIAARLDGLEPVERRLLADASVLGKTFTRAAVAAVTGASDEDAERTLASLVRKEVLTVQADLRSPERGQYGFLQDLVRKIAYDTLSKRERRAKHLAVAAQLEASFGPDDDEVVEVLASHYLEAYRSAPESEDAAAIRDRAREMLTRAGERAASLAASEEALRYFQQAIDLCDEELTRAELLVRAGEMAVRTGAVAPGRKHLEASIAAFEAIGRSREAARVSARVAELDFLEGHTSEAVRRMEEAFGVLAGGERDESLAVVAGQLGRFLVLSRQSEHAAEYLELALELAEALELPEVFSQALNTRGIAIMTRGRRQEAEVLLRHALDVALANDLVHTALRAYNNLLFLLDQEDRYEESMALNRAAIGLARRAGYRVDELTMMMGLASSLAIAGQWDEATELAEATRFEDVAESVEFAWTGLLDVIPIHVHRGDIETARAILQRLSSLADSEDLQRQTGYQLASAIVLLAEGHLDEALAKTDSVLARLKELGVNDFSIKQAIATALEAALALENLPKVEEILAILEHLPPGELTPLLRAHGARFGARLAALRSEHDRVEAGFQAATSLYRRLGLRFRVATTLLEHGEWLVGQRRTQEAAPLLDEAEATFAELRATPWLERVAAARHRRTRVVQAARVGGSSGAETSGHASSTGMP